MFGHFEKTSCGKGLKKALSLAVMGSFMLTGIVPAGYAQGVMDLPRPGAMVLPSAAYAPVSLRAVKVYPDQPLVFDFIVDSGDTSANQSLIKTETEKLVKYFLASLTIPEKDLWVNLSPYEHDRIVPEAFGQTEMGRDLLAQDYILKQLTASLIYPEKDLGKEFWSRVYAKVTQVLGTADLPTNTFNKVWIMPDQAKVYEVGDTAILGDTRMKVMMEEDYLALKQNSKDPSAGMDQMNNADIRDAAKSASDVMRQVVIPEIEKEINTGKNFALLRQVYQAMVLAMWYKNNLKDSLLGQVYADKNKVDGVDILDKTDKEKIYQRYIAAYKEGVFNYIKEDVDPVTQETLPRKYFSGGFNGDHAEKLVRDNTEKVTADQLPTNVRNGDGSDRLSMATVAIQKPEPVTRNSQWDTMLAGQRQYSVESDLKEYGEQIRAYWSGTKDTTAYNSNIKAAGPDDVRMVDEMDEKDAILYEKVAVNFLNEGKFMAGTMVAGASSRMNVEEAPEYVIDMNGGKKFLSKALVPVGKREDEEKPITYLGYFMRDFKALEDQIKEAAEAAGVVSKVSKNGVLLLSNETYLPEHVQAIREHGGFGFSEDRVHFYLQPTAPVMLVRPEVVRAVGGSPEQIKLAEQAQEEFKKGNLEALLDKKDRQASCHGDFFDQLIASGKLIEIYDQGIEVISVRNIDNIGARFDRYFLRTLGFFLEHKLDFQGEVTPRAPGQRGGNLIIRTDTDNRVFLEDPILRATVDLNGTPIVSPSDSYWLNSAVGLFTKHYVISLYKESNQTDDQFIENLRRASPEQRVTIAAKGRDRSPVMFDAKPGKGTVALTTKPAGESNLWMSTTAAPDDVKIGAIGVRGVRNLPLEKLSDMSIAELKEVLAPVRFVSAKQWVMSPEKRAAALVEFKKQIGPEVSDEKLDVMLNYILETYEGNKPLVDVLFELVFKGERFVKKEMFDASEGNKVKKVDSSTGGIDFDPAQLNLKIERTGAGMKVTVDPAELQRIKSDGVSGFRPVILNITPVKSLLPS